MTYRDVEVGERLIDAPKLIEALPSPARTSSFVRSVPTAGLAHPSLAEQQHSSNNIAVRSARGTKRWAVL